MKEHNANEISVSIANFPIEDGRGEIGGDFLKITPRGPAFGDLASQDGEVSRFKTNERRYDVSLFVMSTASANGFLSALHTSDLNIPNGAGVGTFQVNDRNSAGTVYFGEHCWITQMPEHAVGEKPVLLEWKMTVVMSVAFIAGN